MKLNTIKQQFHKELDPLYGNDEVHSFFYLLTENYFNMSRIQLALQPDFEIDDGDNAKMLKALERLKQNEPIQYILGETEFYGLPFKVTPDTLIPRPETEELVTLVLQNSKQQILNSNTLRVLDIGTGTGCIAISLAKHLPNTKVYALDVSKEALKVAKHNAELNDVDLTFIEASILDTVNCHSALDAESTFDIIVSNPPYVRNLEKAEIKANVLDNEPHLALFVEDDNPLQFYKAITEFAVNNLTPNGQLFFEINEYLGNETRALLEQHHFSDIELKQDMFGKDRMVCGVKGNNFTQNKEIEQSI